MPLRLFRLKRTPQPAPSPGSPVAPADADPTDPMMGKTAPTAHAKPKRSKVKAPKRKPKAKGKPAKKRARKAPARSRA